MRMRRQASVRPCNTMTADFFVTCSKAREKFIILILYCGSSDKTEAIKVLI